MYMVLVKAIADLAAPHASSAEVVGVAVALEYKDVALLELEATCIDGRDLDLRDIA
jgi:hypothetical protein